MNTYKMKYIFILTALYCSTAFSQGAFTEEKTLWVCKFDTSLKVTFRYSNYSNIIEINGPLFMDTASAISGTLRISDGSFEEAQSTPQQKAEMALTNAEPKTKNVQEKEIAIRTGFFSVQFFYYNTKVKPLVTFDGNCITKKTKQLDKDLQMSPNQKKELLKKIEDDKQNPKIKTKTAVIGDRG